MRPEGKAWIIHESLPESRGAVEWGWQRLDGRPIQGLEGSHNADHVDYSMCEPPCQRMARICPRGRRLICSTTTARSSLGPRCGPLSTRSRCVTTGGGFPQALRERLARPVRVVGLVDDFGAGFGAIGQGVAEEHAGGRGGAGGGRGRGRRRSRCGWRGARRLAGNLSSAAGSAADTAATTAKWALGLALAFPAISCSAV